MEAEAASKHEELDAREKQLEEARTAQEARATELVWEAVVVERAVFEELVARKRQEFEGCTREAGGRGHPSPRRGEGGRRGPC